jgi:hypothetical protein
MIMRHNLAILALAAMLSACAGDPGPTFKDDNVPFKPACQEPKDCPPAPTDNNASNRPAGRKSANRSAR